MYKNSCSSSILTENMFRVHYRVQSIDYFLLWDSYETRCGKIDFFNSEQMVNTATTVLSWCEGVCVCFNPYPTNVENRVSS